jgi:2-polyprenyl-6-methoxyphenol hydroxylase-like FAD-dependent oxidoreductase
MNEVLIVGAGIGGLTFALELHRHKIACRIFEAPPQIKPIGVGINLLPHATRVLENRRNPPDVILREVFERTHDKPFRRIEEVIGEAELIALSDSYKRVAGYDRRMLGEARET